MEVVLILSFLVVLPSIFLDTNTQVDAFHPPTSALSAEKHVYIVYMSEGTSEGLNPQTYYIKVLSPVLGSEEAAKEALIYSYRIISGFAAKLNAHQAAVLRKQSGVAYVNRETRYCVDDPIRA